MFQQWEINEEAVLWNSLTVLYTYSAFFLFTQSEKLIKSAFSVPLENLGRISDAGRITEGNPKFSAKKVSLIPCNVLKS